MSRVNVRLEWGDEPTLDVATIAIDRGELLLEFSDDYLDAGLDLAPLRLPPAPGVHRHPLGDPFGALPGLLDDTMPDAWGLRVMDSHLRQLGHPRPDVLQRLLWLGRSTMGALTHHPDSRANDRPLDVDLSETAVAAAAVISGDAAEILDVLQRAGGSPGGARPKIVVGMNQDGHLITGESELPSGYTGWLIKFAAPSDPEDHGLIEHAYLMMGRAAGIDTVDAVMLAGAAGGRHLAVRRFDRVGEGPATARRQAATVSGLLHADHRIPSVSYDTVLRLTRRLTNDQRDVTQMFRRAVFNVAAHNRDDHSKNTSFVMAPDGQWRLAPAYDLTWSAGPGGEHTTDVAGKGTNITRDDLLSLARPAGMDVGAAGTVIDDVMAAVSNWSEVAKASGLDRATVLRVAQDHQLL